MAEHFLLYADEPYSLPVIDTRTLLEQLAKRAFDFFWRETHPDSGFTKDRASNYERDRFEVSSIAASGYALASLPIAVRRGWLSRTDALRRAHQMMDGHSPTGTPARLALSLHPLGERQADVAK
jgi:hypothetical protein